VARLLRQAEQTAVDLIRAHRTELHKLVDMLLEQETVDGSVVYRIVGRPSPEHKPELNIAPRAVAASHPAVPDGSRAGAHPDGQDAG
jgi:cell division protease FtsH